MLHPDTELRYIDSTIGYGVFATRFIPKGTITWVRDALDQTFSRKHLTEFTPTLRAMLDRYTFVDKLGDHVLCWDLGRYVNHACEATCLSPGYSFEIAVRDIEAGEELTDDYGALNIDSPFTCCCGSPNCRQEIRPNDLLVYGDRWDELIAESFRLLPGVHQPLWDLVPDKPELAKAVTGMEPILSCRQNYFGPPPVRVAAGSSAGMRLALASIITE